MFPLGPKELPTIGIWLPDPKTKLHLVEGSRGMLKLPASLSSANHNVLDLVISGALDFCPFSVEVVPPFSSFFDR